MADSRPKRRGLTTLGGRGVLPKRRSVLNEGLRGIAAPNGLG